MSGWSVFWASLCVIWAYAVAGIAWVTRAADATVERHRTGMLIETGAVLAIILAIAASAVVGIAQ